MVLSSVVGLEATLDCVASARRGLPLGGKFTYLLTTLEGGLRSLVCELVSRTQVTTTTVVSHSLDSFSSHSQSGDTLTQGIQLEYGHHWVPKKLVDTVMMLVNANLKTLLGGKAQPFGITMLRHVAVSNQLAGRREFSAVHVAKALLIDQMNTEGFTMWLHQVQQKTIIPENNF